MQLFAGKLQHANGSMSYVILICVVLIGLSFRQVGPHLLVRLCQEAEVLLDTKTGHFLLTATHPLKKTSFSLRFEGALFLYL